VSDRIRSWLQGALFALLGIAAALPALAMEVIDAERELKLLGEGVTPPKRFGNVAFRIAVFSYEDPDGLELGDALAALASHEVLTGARVSSIGVLRYSGRLTPAPGEETGYFDKVELLARNQEPTAALWGMVQRDGADVVVETFLQLPDSTRSPGLQAKLHLPGAMGGGELRATAGSDRLLLQRLRLPMSEAEQLRGAAARLGELREAPREDAPIRARVPLDTVFYLVERQPGWVQLAVSEGARGWVPLSGHCQGPCVQFLEAPRFLSDMLGFIQKRRPPETRDGLSADARQLRDELFAMAALDQAPQSFAHDEAISLLARWQPKPGATAAEGPTLGASAANLRLIARLAGELRRARASRPASRRDAYDEIVLPASTVRSAAFEAAEATVVDPRNADLLHNLQVLYRWLGDTERAELAARLMEQAETASRARW
jgi:hypothetical protein